MGVSDNGNIDYNDIFKTFVNDHYYEQDDWEQFDKKYECYYPTQGDEDLNSESDGNFYR